MLAEIPYPKDTVQDKERQIITISKMMSTTNSWKHLKRCGGSMR
jgi:hypothetical protein